MAENESEKQSENALESDFARALQDLAKGERQAKALEDQLSTMEAKIDALLAQAEKDQEEIQSARRTSGRSNVEDPPNDSKESSGEST